VAYTFKHGDRPLEGVTVQRAIGRGGFGEVYYALADSGKQVALKYLRENPEIELRGIAHVMNLKSPHLITIYDVKRNPAGEPFVIMEYVSGPSLRELLMAEPGGFSVQKAAFFLSGIAKGLSYLHERGIVHRDLKPANIFYDDGYVKIGDYGLSKHMSVSQHSGQTVSVGTVHYMAPEIGSGSYTKAIDIYALGVILYEMLTGRLPYSGASMAEVLMRHLRDRPDLSGIPQPFAGVIAKALAKDPQERYQDADEMLAAIMESGDVGRSIDSFDATSLSRVPRAPEASDQDPTLTSPHRPSPPPLPSMDVRAPLPGQPLPERLQRKLDRLNEKLARKAAKLEQKLGPRRGGVPIPAAPAATPKVNRRGQMFVLLAVAAAISVAFGSLAGSGRSPETWAVCIALFIIGGTVGPLIAHLRLLRNSPLRNTLLIRLAHASMAGLLMLPAFGIAADELDHRFAGDVSQLILAPIVAILLCDWGKRIEAGRRGRVDGWAAFWPALIGFVLAQILDLENYAWVAAGICAAIALLTQAAASMWPAVATPTPFAVPPLPTTPPKNDAAVQAVAPLAEAATSLAQAAATQASSPPPPPAELITASQPSFVGRTAHAGVSFLGKVLLLIGLVWALGQDPALHYAREYANEASAHGVRVDRDIQQLIDSGVPRGLPLIPLVLGSLLLMAARRRDGVRHFVRGACGYGLVCFGALSAILWGSRGLQGLFVAGDMSGWDDPEFWGPMLLTTLGLGVGALLLLWPAQRDNRPIVI